MAASSPEAYYKILGITSQATAEEIRHAYRTRAKELHPDLNKSPDAHEQFILLNEAYEFLLTGKTGKEKAKRPAASYADWERRRREQARERARQYAKMKYEEFEKSDLYRGFSYAETIFDHLLFLFAVAILIVFPLVALITLNIYVIIWSVVILAITAQVTIPAIRNTKNLSFKNFKDSVIHVIRFRAVQFIALTVLNLFLIFKIGLQTLIPFYEFAALFILPPLVVYFLSGWLLSKTSRSGRLFTAFGLLPFLVNLFFTLNFVFSSNPTIEKYPYTRHRETSKHGMTETTLILLENDKYSEYPGIRIFFNYEKMQGTSIIIYVFKDGLFNIRVMTDYVFTAEYPDQ